MKIYILGDGVMAKAMTIGLKDKFEIVIVSRRKVDISEFGGSNIKNELYGKSYDISDKNIILAFKPYALKEVASKLIGRAKNCISVLAMTKLEDLECINSQNLACAIANIASELKASTTVYYSKGDDCVIKEILSEMGDIFKVNSYEELKIGGVISGCVPAYLALVNEALQNGGVKEGLKKDISANLVNSVFLGSAKLMQNIHPAIIKEKVCSPAGTTIEGVYSLEKSKIRASFIKALNKSANKK